MYCLAVEDEIKQLEKLEQRFIDDATAEPVMLWYDVLRKITNGFKEVIGEGGFGIVYKGVVENREVAVKKLLRTDEFSEKQFQDEVSCLTNVKHKNIVKFLGYCSTTHQKLVQVGGVYVWAEVRLRFLCFEYVPNKSLHDYLKEKSQGREWSTRFGLIKGICQGLDYLHNEERINHLDLKPENILLDADLVPKITDFGLSRRFGGDQSRMITEQRFGTLGFTAPEFLDGGLISFKSDIYSLGIIIIKILRGSNDVPNFKNWHESLDIDGPQVKRCIEIAQTCIDPCEQKRPKVGYIVDTLNAMEGVVEESADQVSSELLEMLVVEPQEVHFTFEVKKQISCSLKVTNNTDDYIAFKWQTTQPKKYITVPNKGILLPHSTCEVVISMRAQEEAPPNMQCNDKFLLLSTRVKAGSSAKDITNDTFSKKESGKVVNEQKLLAIYDAPPQQSSTLCNHDAVEGGFVLTADATNFENLTAKHPIVVIEFYVPWSEHCKALTPEYEKAAQLLSKQDQPIVLAKVNVDEEGNKPIAAKYGIIGFPTLMIFSNQGKNIQEYKGPRDADGIVEYLMKQIGPASKEIKSPEDVVALTNDKKINIVGIFAKFCGTEFTNFMEVAKKLQSDDMYYFSHTLQANYLPRGDAAFERPTVRLMKPFDELVVDSKNFDVCALEMFIQANSIPKVAIFDKNPDNKPYLLKYFNISAAKAMLYLNFSSRPLDLFKSACYGAAEEFKDKGLKFLIGDIEASHGALEYYGLKEEQEPIFLIDDGHSKFLKEQIEPDQIVSWVKLYLDKKLSSYRKSQPIPEVNDDPVKVVVADSLDDVVFKSGKNVLIEFYAPWCQYCKNLAPNLEQAATTLLSDEDVVIAKMDATMNDIPKEFSVDGYPSVYFITPSGTVTYYAGDRTADEIIDFIKKNKETSRMIMEDAKVINDVDSKELLKIHPLELRFPIVLNQQISRSLHLTNMSHDSWVLYMVVIPSTSKYRVHPSNFVVPPQSTWTVIVTMEAKEAPPDMQCNETFVIDSTTSREVPDSNTIISFMSAVTLGNKAHQVHEQATVKIVYIPPEEVTSEDSEDFSVSAKFLEADTIPHVVFYNGSPNVDFLRASRHPWVKVFLTLDFSSSLFDTFKSECYGAAEMLRENNLILVIFDYKVSHHIFEFYSVKEDQLPFICVLDDDSSKEYFKRNIDADQVLPWLKEYIDGKLKSSKQSEPIPEVNDEPVKVIVADNLTDMVFRSGKNVLLFIYMPQTDEFEEIIPILKDVAVSFEKDNDVIIAKMDMCKNYVPSKFDLDVSRLFFVSVNRKITYYDGEHTYDGIVNFINKNKETIRSEHKPRVKIQSSRNAQPSTPSMCTKKQWRI